MDFPPLEVQSSCAGRHPVQELSMSPNHQLHKGPGTLITCQHRVWNLLTSFSFFLAVLVAVVSLGQLLDDKVLKKSLVNMATWFGGVTTTLRI